MAMVMARSSWDTFTAPADSVRSPQPALAGFLAVLGVLTVVVGLYSQLLRKWSHEGQASLGIAAEDGER